MDRPTTRADGAAPDLPEFPRDSFVLPSRRNAMEACRASLDSGPILLTGDPGAGKTWLWSRLAADSAAPRGWLDVDVTPAIAPDDLYRLIAREMGLPTSDASRMARSEIADFLADRQVNGDRRALVIEEAHNLTLEVWEEVRVLANRLGRADGFSSLLLVGQSALARRFSTWPYAPIESRLAARIHLGPIDADEASDLLANIRPGHGWTRAEAEELHRDSGGNPGRMLRRAGLFEGTTPKLIAPRARSVAIAPPAPAIGVAPVGSRPRPPLRVEENLIEVGWSPDEPPELEGAGEVPASPGVRSHDGSPMGEEAVHDHYAALQAWREWAENQGRGGSIRSDRDRADAIDDEAAAGAIEEEAPPADRPTVWADRAEEPFAPFSQLFSRMTQSRPRAPE